MRLWCADEHGERGGEWLADRERAMRADGGDMMVNCAGKACRIEWFHLGCLEREDVEGGWRCDKCRGDGNRGSRRSSVA